MVAARTGGYRWTAKGIPTERGGDNARSATASEPHQGPLPGLSRGRHCGGGGAPRDRRLDRRGHLLVHVPPLQQRGLEAGSAAARAGSHQDGRPVRLLRTDASFAASTSHAVRPRAVPPGPGHLRRVGRLARGMLRALPATAPLRSPGATAPTPARGPARLVRPLPIIWCSSGGAGTAGSRRREGTT
jgi:hypothetical protein